MEGDRSYAWERLESDTCTTMQDNFVCACQRIERSTTLPNLLLKLPCVHIEGRNWQGLTALAACLVRDKKLSTISVAPITWLLSKGADINAFCGVLGWKEYSQSHLLGVRAYTCNPLLFAAAGHNEALVRLLLNMGAAVNIPNSGGERPIHVCVRASPRRGDHWGHETAMARIIDCLDRAGADLDANMRPSPFGIFLSRHAGQSPLVCAVQSDNEFAAVYLLCLNCDPDGGYDSSHDLFPNPLCVAVNRAFINVEFITIFMMVGCRLDSIRERRLSRLTPHLKAFLSTAHTLQDLCLARVRKSLRSGPFGAAGAGAGIGISGYRRLELGVRGLPLSIGLKRRVLMVGLRKLLRRGQASFRKRRVRIRLIGPPNNRYLRSQILQFSDSDADDEDDKWHDRDIQ